jgi:opine dehydrogenase
LKVSIIGAGNGGLAATADLTLRGFSVVLYEHPDFAANLEAIKAAGSIGLSTLPSTGLSGGFAQPTLLTTDAGEALQEAEVVLLIAPAFAHESLATQISPYLREGQRVVLMPGGFGGALLFHKKLRETRGNHEILVGETATLPYACRKLDATSVWIRGRKATFQVGAYPGRSIDTVLEVFRLLYPHAQAAVNVMETALNNLNPFLHPAIMLLNAASVDRRERTLFYHEALTASARKLIEALDEERLALGKAMSISLKPAYRELLDHYQHQGACGENVQEVAKNNPIYQWSETPTTLYSRYLTEDIPMNLVPMAQLARQLGSPCVNMEAMITVCSSVLGEDLHRGARTLEQMGMEGLEAKQITQALEEGTL